MDIVTTEARQPTTHLAMFAKYWQAGSVKTRLAQSIGAEKAKEVYLVLLNHLLNVLGNFGQRRTVVFSPADRCQEFRELVPAGWNLQPQSSGDLGDRMRNFFFSRFSNGRKENVILIGSDTPDICPELLSSAVIHLQTHAAVLGPSVDGGYYLIGLNCEVPEIFTGVQWSTELVLQQTLEILDSLNLEYKLLPPMNDVDDLTDLKELLVKIEGSSELTHQQLRKSIRDLAVL